MYPVFVVYDELVPEPDINVSDVDSDSVTLLFDFGERSTKIIGVFPERWQADLCAAQHHCYVVEAPFEGDQHGR